MATENLLALMQQQLMEQRQQHQEQMEMMLAAIGKREQGSGSSTSTHSTQAWPAFTAFDSTSELWRDYWSRFKTYTQAHSIPDDRQAAVFLTCQGPSTYKILSNLATQQTPPQDVNELSLKTIEEFVEEQFHSTRFVVRERFKFWSNMQRKPRELVHQLAARIHQDAITCDFESITKPLDEAMRTKFICSLQNEAVLKAFLKTRDADLAFAKAIEIAVQVEEATKVAKETICSPVHEVVMSQKNKSQKDVKCMRCDRKGHKATKRKYKEAKCNCRTS